MDREPNSSSPLWLVETESTVGANNGFVEDTGRFDFYDKLSESFGFDYSNFQFMISPAGTGAAPHYHNSALNLLVLGLKKWLLFPPSRAIYSTKPVRDWYAEDYMAMPEEDKPLACLQHPGDIMWV